MKKTIRAILNGKKAGNPELRDAIMKMRDKGIDVQVRVTWESQDMPRLVKEAVAEGIERIVVAGGDGTVNEAASAIIQIDKEKRPELAIIPLGTANDFATSIQVPNSIKASLSLAVEGQSALVDCVKANDRCFINVATAGFGAEVTAETPVELKNFLGGGAYTLTGVVKALGFKPYDGTITIEGGAYQGEMLLGAFCNGRLAGGGQELAPKAMINDGLMDLTLVRPFLPHELPKVIDEINNPSEKGEFVKYTRASWLEIDFPNPLPLNLDGEPYHSRTIRFDVQPKSIRLVVPQDCPCLTS
ncbi:MULTISPECIES: lipid kinase YegS [unclassified Vibrio]|uniref:lipid kinase YegS n=1 Tax=unclassified Vibrio TaxID=2614977 RepID=UPI001A1BCCBA|nr:MULTISPECIES: lipid kinase YegS [unclassified Vibrio]EGQ7762776.1 lipid kinase YegS [Vibrio alginolyticus]MDW1520510.1 lipid kinase YegS [Vibrio sp. Vb5032]MDW2002303.1 lipid kinase YegS [Vibrio sp. 2304]MDW2190615.1 lipid kinase YegS [Vibrio sp. 1641]